MEARAEDVVHLDAKGRLSVPKHIREALGLSPEEELVVTLDEGEIRVRPVVRRPRKLRIGRRWGKDAFLKAGEALFAGE